jgi:hypothetical protein
VEKNLQTRIDELEGDELKEMIRLIHARVKVTATWATEMMNEMPEEYESELPNFAAKLQAAEEGVNAMIFILDECGE